MPHTRSTLRTLITKASDARRIAEQNMQGIAMIRDRQKRGSTAYDVAQQCYNVAKATFDQQDTLLKQLQEERREVGGYDRKKPAGKGPSKNALAVARQYKTLMDQGTTRDKVIEQIATAKHISLQAAEREFTEYLGLLEGGDDGAKGS
jgi:hypothetical protein